MVEFNSLNTATLNTVTRFHNFAKNIETAHLGNLYTTVIDGIDYYVVECAAKPLLGKAPEWVYENRVVDSIKNYKGLYILAAGIITLFFINYMLHAKDGVQGPGLKPTSPDSDGEKNSKIKDADGKGKPKNSTSSSSDGEEDFKIKDTGGKGKSKDRTSSHSNDEEGPLEVDSDLKEEVKTKDQEKETKNNVNSNGDNVDDVEASKKDNPTIETLIVNEEVDINPNPSTAEKEKVSLMGTTLGGPGNYSVDKVEKPKNDQESVVKIGATTGSGSTNKPRKENENTDRVKDSYTVGNGKNKNNKGKNKKNKRW